MTLTTAEFKQRISRFPRVSLGNWPTPLHPTPRLAEFMGGPPIWFKREDLSGLAFGGNKTRMLEFTLADVQQKGADVIVTGAGVQSNSCRQMAAACAKLGIDVELVLIPIMERDAQEVQGNHLLQRLFGAKVTFTYLPGPYPAKFFEPDPPELVEAVNARVAQLEAKGKKPYVPRTSDVIYLDALGLVQCAIEMVEQMEKEGIDPQAIVVPSADTTHAGLVLGLRALGYSIPVYGYNPLPSGEEAKVAMAQIANQTGEQLGLEMEFKPDDFDSDDSFIGEAYGVPTQAGLEALVQVARTEGILLDPVYTGKAMAGLISRIRRGDFEPTRPIIFVHTGGNPAIFAFANEILPFLDQIEP